MASREAISAFVNWAVAEMCAAAKGGDWHAVAIPRYYTDLPEVLFDSRQCPVWNSQHCHVVYEALRDDESRQFLESKLCCVIQNCGTWYIVRVRFNDDRVKALRHLHEKFANKKLSHVTVILRVQKVTRLGEEVRAVGNEAALGKWNIAMGLPLTWSDGHVWTGRFKCPPGLVEYKYVVVSGQGCSWENRGNRHIFAKYDVIQDDL